MALYSLQDFLLCAVSQMSRSHGNAVAVMGVAIQYVSNDKVNILFNFVVKISKYCKLLLEE